MKVGDLLATFARSGKRAVLIGDSAAGMVVALDLEGRWYAVLDGEVLNRVNPKAIVGNSTREEYLNPGGDGLWPAPEGTSLGYQYAAGAWRVPPGLRTARFQVVKVAKHSITICAEVDLVNNRGRGLPTRFERRLAVAPGRRSVTVSAIERIVYVGRVTLRRTEASLAPWTLCQFDSGPGCEVVYPCGPRTAVWDLYAPPSDRQRSREGCLGRTRTDGALRYQIALDASVPWIEYRDPRRGLTVRRQTAPLPAEQSYLDIRDAPPDARPSRRTVRYSIYSDTANFMEIEAAGGCPPILQPNAAINLSVTTRFALGER